ncbi:uncharacterized protein CELE_K09C8.9 [Caenorhabditis elegans]|uniref:Secreted protein n=1 Tax=Caenorhabditis elegans TaxID=6239 RepID=B6VQ69_CAEEL|nr:Secreted protein [Caenorhabditis elegans]CAR97844.1 Secreted protein [Caenorhabditis elegans]|eukprot:NP_001257127.1 Uncharacterized protein CELE_K09C8.9 [Caenorhabditis elegans]
MFRLTLVSLALLVCTINANLFDSFLRTEKEVVVVNQNDQGEVNAEISQNPSEDTSLAVIDNDTPIALMDDLGSEGQGNGVVIRAKRYYGCGCGCCGCCNCATMAPVSPQPCGCGCCGCGYG